jgi:hypothetical protein
MIVWMSTVDTMGCCVYSRMEKVKKIQMVNEAKRYYKFGGMTLSAEERKERVDNGTIERVAVSSLSKAKRS